MGIGVSYTGYDGTTRNFRAGGAADLARLMPSIGRTVTSASAQMAPRAQRREQPLAQVQRPDAVDGPLVGIEGNESLSPDGCYRMVGSRGGWRIPVTRTEMDVKPSLVMKCNEVTLVKLQYDLIISEKGFVKGRTEEREVWRKSFFATKEDADDQKGADGKWGSRLIYKADESDPVHPVPLAVAFGSEADLGTYDEKSGKFACNYDESGAVLDNPPVKVIGVAEPDVELEDTNG